ncbi:type III secretion system cytoplasmic ring protein SctQ [Mesorhizobium sp.]|uniref:type III secretion system cytoplasmic ring protein SctQ n=1 Tax=Mesorhizobium sp. TaxID=1871066 RepID=UPI000FE8D4D6|nr:type III secretion system cytoplasmic ring protein SctQ [Mesorhizobium sp.]RWM16381.1 MAG: YscQ/HrcQ family type III secretion apparatus protein [Mesorhizobium sp.]TIP72400.1 MAG: YscQ/HrcQ family type III secretion apparatus protein [Mesorhizobium sp.]TIQ11455.1 MAG: YscQ/HrcQ family type III secretion apparatus protein [Mesorhizobium sp.]TJV96572.1 MAG: YscQ/HrcQ family type III secretion apparatus protein [Mesorhizobium sp.]
MPQALASAKKKARAEPVSSSVGEPLTLESVAAVEVEASNAFYRRRAPAQITIVGKTMAIAVVWPAANPQDQPLCTIAFTVSDTAGKLRLPLAVVERGLGKADEAIDLKRLAPAHAALLLESVFEEDLEWIESKLGERIAITSVEQKDSVLDETAFAFVLTGKDETIDCALYTGSVGLAVRAGAFLDAIGKVRPPVPADFPLLVCLWRNALTISLGDLQSLQPGDVVLFDDEEEEAAFVIAERLYAPAVLTASGPQLLAAPTAIAGSKWEWTMNQNTPPHADQTLEESTLDELPVALAFELGRTAMPLGEVRQLAPGAIVPLANVTKETVDIIANGKRVGRGEIVRIGENLGVRIARMFDNA